MDSKEKKVQNALGTMKSQMYVQADWKDVSRLIEEFEKALNNFGLFMYNHPDWEGSDEFAFIISNEQLTDNQIGKLCDIPMDKNKECIEVLQRIESNITATLRQLELLHTGNFAHAKGMAQALLTGCKDTWIKKLRELLNDGNAS